MEAFSFNLKLYNTLLSSQVEVVTSVLELLAQRFICELGYKRTLPRKLYWPSVSSVRLESENVCTVYLSVNRSCLDSVRRFGNDSLSLSGNELSGGRIHSVRLRFSSFVSLSFRKLGEFGCPEAGGPLSSYSDSGCLGLLGCYLKPTGYGTL